MTTFGIAWRQVLHEPRLSAALLLAIGLGVAVLAGAFAAGDTLAAALRRFALERTGAAEIALVRQGGAFRDAMADEIAAETGHACASVLRLRGTAEAADHAGRLLPAWIVGVDGRFGALAAGAPFGPAFTEGAWLSASAARRLRLGRGDELVVRVPRLDPLPPEAALAAQTRDGLRVRVAGVVPDDQMGRFGLEADARPPDNVFLPLSVLQNAVGAVGRANVVLVTSLTVGGSVGESEATPESSARLMTLARDGLRRRRRLVDLDLEIRTLPGRGWAELRSTRLWLDPDVAQCALGLDPQACGIVTYLVKALQCGTNVSPYAFVAGGDDGAAPWPVTSDGLVLNDWAASDLAATTGSVVTLVYDRLLDGGRMEAMSRTMRVERVLPIGAFDRDLAPLLPGVTDTADCRAWHGGPFVDTRLIRPKDQAYWTAYRGTPRALVTGAAARAMWATPWGVTTAVRYPPETGSSREIALRLLSQLPESLSGWQWIPLRERFLAASRGTQDFGTLFVALSLVLVAAVVFLVAMLFGLRADRRMWWTGLLRAVGYHTHLIQELALLEGLILAAFGAVVGGLGALGFGKLVLHATDRITPRDALFGGAPMRLAPEHLAIAILGTIGVALVVQSVVVAWGQRWQVREQLEGPVNLPSARHIRARRTVWLTAAGAAVVTAAMLVLWARRWPAGPAAAAYVASGGLTLAAGLLLLRGALARRAESTVRSLFHLGVANAARRPSRAILTAGLVGVAAFLLILLSASSPQIGADASRRAGGTGGYGWVVESLEPLPAVPPPLRDAECLPVRVQPGDDASCLNPQRAVVPRLAGVDARRLAARGAFTFVASVAGLEHPGSWVMLTDSTEAAAPAVVDETTLAWGLRCKLGDTVSVLDDAGRPFPVRIVGVIADSVFQGTILIDESVFRLRFPSVAGYRLLLADAPGGNAAAWASETASALEPLGATLTPTVDRLAEFQRVEHVYLGIFAALGWLALLLAIVGISLVMVHQAEERRGELAYLRAAGFGRMEIGWVLTMEQGLSLVAGAACGAAGACVAMLPLAWRMHQACRIGEGLLALGLVILCGLGVSVAVVRNILQRPVAEGLRLMD